ncbi:MAG TPA: MMPL family transporter, partial [Nitrososphaerales archaeon]|nr:MMPL family transporter [Nitrososphaerales archaeon]
MIFGRLGRAITRRYKLIVPLWIIALVLATPLILRATSVVSLQQGSTSNLGLEAQIAQNLVNTKFGSSSPSGSPLVVVISSGNATTTTKVHDYVIALSEAIAGDRSLPDYVSGSSAYSSVSTLLTGVSEPEARLSDGAALLNQLFYGVPSLFLSVWSTQFGANQSMIPQAQAATLRTISSEILNQTQLLASQDYLTIFTRALSDSFHTQESLPLALRVQVAIRTAGANFTQSVLPASQRPFALLVIRSFSLSNFTDSVAIERFVINQITKVTLFTPELATAAYPLTRNSSASFRDQISESVVNDPSRFNIPPVYRSTISGFVSHDGRVMLATFVFKNVTTSELNEVRKLVQSTALPYGLAGSVQVTGQDALNSDITASILNDTDIILPITIVLLLVATGLFFRSVITPFISLGTISIALGLAEVVVFLVATYVSQVDVSTPVILLTVLIGVGTDYSIFIIARYREERVRGGSPAQSVENAVTWAGESIATSGATVIISFIFLGFQPITFLKGLGLVVGLGVLIALIASLTLIPSVILLLPKR